MKVLIVGLATFDQMAGGSARYLTGITNALRRLGHTVEVKTAADHVPTVGYSERGFFGQVRRVVIRLMVTMPRTAWSVLAGQPDIANIHFALDGVPAVIAARIRRIPVVVNFQGPWAVEAVATGRRGQWPLSTRTRAAIERFVYRRASRCIVLSEAFGKLLQGRYGVDRERIHVIPAGVETKLFAHLPSRPEARRRLGLPEAYTVTTVRRLVPRMGIELAIDALAEVLQELDATLVIAGSGPERERLEQHARSRGLAGHVRFLGRIPDDQLPTFYAAGDVCVVPSRELEGFGYVALEALASGTPVIAVETGGLRELVGALEPRWVVAADSEAIASAIKRLAADPSAYPDDTACRQYAGNMDWSRIAPRVLEVFAEAIEKRDRLTGV